MRFEVARIVETIGKSSAREPPLPAITEMKAVGVITTTTREGILSTVQRTHITLSQAATERACRSERPQLADYALAESSLAVNGEQLSSGPSWLASSGA